MIQFHNRKKIECTIEICNRTTYRSLLFNFRVA